MPKKYYDQKNRCCSRCGMLMTKEAFKFHTQVECFMTEMNNMQREEEIKKLEQKRKEKEIMEQPKEIVVKEIQPAIITLMENPEKAVAMYDSIKKNFLNLLRNNGEVIKIKNKEYVKYEGWQTIGTALGILPKIVEITKNDDFYQAKAEVILVKTGVIIGSAYGICSREEANWKDKPEYAIIAMAQTRAAGRALKMILSGFIAHCGFEATPAEEMSEVFNDDDTPASQKETPKGGATEKQQKAVYAVLRAKGISNEEITKKLGADYGVEKISELTFKQASEIINLYGKK